MVTFLKCIYFILRIYLKILNKTRRILGFSIEIILNFNTLVYLLLTICVTVAILDNNLFTFTAYLFTFIVFIILFILYTCLSGFQLCLKTNHSHFSDFEIGKL